MSSFPNDPIECVVCPGLVSRVQTAIDVAVGKRESVSVEGLFAKCDSCGEVYLAPGEVDAVHRQASDTIRSREGLLGPDEIRAIRDSLGITQAGLEQLLRVGSKTVVRWERGTTFQNRATDTLLRALRDVPGMIDFLTARACESPAIMHPMLVTFEFPVALASVEQPAETLWTGNEQSASIGLDTESAPAEWALEAA